MTTLLIVAPDLLFQSRIRDAAGRLGFAVRIADTAEEARAVIGDGIGAMVLDLHAPGVDAPALIGEAASAGVRVLAFGRHTDAPALRAAREAGAHAVVARSQLVEELPRLLEALATAP